MINIGLVREINRKFNVLYDLDMKLAVERMADALFGTGDAVLAECAVHDKIWGIGLSMTDPDRFDRKKWKGHSLLGYALMMVREKLLR